MNIYVVYFVQPYLILILKNRRICAQKLLCLILLILILLPSRFFVID